MEAVPSAKVYYGRPMLPDVSRVLACLFEKDVKFKLIHIHEDLQISDFLKLQLSPGTPKAPITVFEDGCTLLFDSRAICRYIAEKHVHLGNKYLLGRDLLERASIEQWLKVEEQSFHPPSWELIFHLAFAPQANFSIERALLTQSEKKLARVLDVYEHRLSESRFLAGNEFTLADLSHLPNSHFLENSEKYSYLFDSRKNVRRWLRKISKRPSWTKVIDLWETVNDKLNEVPVEQEDTGAEDSEKTKTTLHISPSISSRPQSSHQLYHVPPLSETASFVTSTQPTPTVQTKPDTVRSETTHHASESNNSLKTDSTTPSTTSKPTPPDPSHKTTNQPFQEAPSAQSTTQTPTTTKSTSELNHSTQNANQVAQTVSTTLSAAQPPSLTQSTMQADQTAYSEGSTAQVQNNFSNPKPQQDPSENLHAQKDIATKFTPKHNFQSQNNSEKTDNEKAKSGAASSIIDASLSKGTGGHALDKDNKNKDKKVMVDVGFKHGQGDKSATFSSQSAVEGTQEKSQSRKTGEEAPKFGSKSKTESESIMLGSDQSNSFGEKISKSKDMSNTESDSTTLKSQKTKTSNSEATLKDTQQIPRPGAATQPIGDSDDLIGEKIPNNKARSKFESDSTTLGSQQTKKSSGEANSEDTQEIPGPTAATQPTKGGDLADSIVEKMSKSKDKSKVELNSTTLGSEQTKKSSGEGISEDTQETSGPAATTQPTEGGDSTDSIVEKMSKSKDKSKVESDSTALGSQQTKKSSSEATSGDNQETPEPAAATQPTEGIDSTDSILEKISESKDKSKVESDSTTLGLQKTNKSSGEITSGDTLKTPGTAAATQPTEEVDSTNSILEKMYESKDKSKIGSDFTMLGSQQTKKSSGKANLGDTQETPGPTAATKPTEGGDLADSIVEKMSKSKDNSKVESDSTTLVSQQTKKSSGETTLEDTQKTPRLAAVTQPTEGADSTDSTLEKMSESKDKSKVESDSTILGSQQTKKSSGEINSGNTQETPVPVAARKPTEGGDSTDSILEKMSESKDKSKVESNSTTLGSQQTKKSSDEVTSGDAQETPGPTATTQPTRGDSTDSIVEKMFKSKDKSKVESDSTTLGSQQTKKSNGEANSGDTQETPGPAAATQPTEGGDSTDSILEKMSESKDKSKIESDSTTLGSQQTKKSSGEITPEEIQETRGPAAATQPTERGDSTDSILEKMSESKGKSKVESDSTTLGSQQTKKSSSETTSADNQETPEPVATTQPTEGIDSTDSILEKISESKDKTKVESDSTMLESQQTKKSSGEINSGNTQETPGPTAARQPTEGGDSTDSILEKMSESKDKSKVESDFTTLGSQQTKKSSDEATSGDIQETPGPAATTQTTEGGDLAASIIEKMSKSKDKSKVESDSTTLVSQHTKKSSGETTLGDTQKTPGPAAATQPTEGADSTDSTLEKMSESKDKSKVESDSSTLGSQQTKKSSGEINSSDTQETPGPVAARQPTEGGDSTDSILEKISESKDKSKVESDYTTLGSQQNKKSSDEVTSGDTKETPGPDATTQPTRGDSTDSNVEKISKSKDKSKVESDSITLGSQQTKKSKGEANSGDTQETPGPAAATQPTEGGDSTDSIIEKMSESKDKSKVESDSTTLGSQQTKKSSGEITPEEIQETRGPAAATQSTEGGDSIDSILEKMSESKDKSKIELDSTTLGSQQTKKSSSEATSADNQETPEPAAATQPTEGIDSTDSILEKISESKDKTKVESDSTTLESQQTKKSSGEINSGDTQETPRPAAARQPTEGGDSTDSILEKISESKDKSKVESDSTTLGSQQTKKSSDEVTSGDTQETPGPDAATQPTEGGDSTDSILEKMSEFKDKSKVESDSTTLGSQQTKKSSGEITPEEIQETRGPAAAKQPIEGGDSTDSILEKMSESKDKSKVESDSSTLGSQQTKKSSGEINSSDTQETPGPAAARQPTKGGDSTDSILEKISESKNKSKVESDSTTLGSQQTKKSSEEVTSGDTKETPGPDATTQPTRGDSTDSIVEKISKSKDKSKVESDSITLGSQQTKKSKGEANSGDTLETLGPAAATQPTERGDSTDSILEKMSESKGKSKVESDSTTLGSQQTKKSSSETTSADNQETPEPVATTQPTEGIDSTDSILEKISESKDKSKVESDSTTLGSQQTKKSSGEINSSDTQETSVPAAARQPTEGGDSTDSILEKMSESKDKSKVESDSTTHGSQQTKKSNGEANSRDTQETPGPAAATQPTEGGDSTDSILEKMSESKDKSKDESDSTTLESQQTMKLSGEKTPVDIQETRGPAAATQPTEGGDSTDSILEKMSKSKDKSKVESDSTTLGSQQTKKSSDETTSGDTQETSGPAATTQLTEGGDSTDSIVEKMFKSKDKSKVESDSTTLGSQQTKKSNGEANSGDTQETPGPAAATQPTEGGDSTDSILEKMSESKDKSKVESDSTTLGSQQTKKSSGEITPEEIQESRGTAAATQPTEGGDSTDSIVEKMSESKGKSKVESDYTTLGSQQTKKSSSETTSADNQETSEPAATIQPTEGIDSTESILEKISESKEKTKVESDSTTLESQQTKKSSGEINSGDTQETSVPAAARQPTEEGDSTDSILEKMSESKDKSKVESDFTTLGSQQTKKSSDEATSGDIQETPGPAATTQTTEGGDLAASIIEKMSKSKDKSKFESDSTTLVSQQTKKSSGETTLGDTQKTPGPAAATHPTEGADSTDSTLEKMSESKDKSKVESDSSTLGSQQTKKSSGEINSSDTQETPGPAAARQPTEGGDSTDSILEKISESKDKSKVESDYTTLGSQQTKKSSDEVTSGDTKETPGPDATTQPTRGDSTDSIVEKISKSKDKSKVESDSITLGSQQTKKSKDEANSEDTQETPGPAAATQPTKGGDSTDSILEKMSESKDKSKVESDSTTLGSQQTKKSSGEITPEEIQETRGPAAATQPTEGGDSTDSILEKMSESKDKSKVELDSTTLGSQQTKKSSSEATSADNQETPEPAAATQPTEGIDSTDSILEKISESKDKTKVESDSTTLESQQTKKSSGEINSGDTQKTPGPAAARQPTEGGDSTDLFLEKMSESKGKSNDESDSTTLGSQQTKKSSGEITLEDTQETPGPDAATQPTEGGDSTDSILEKMSEFKDKSKVESDSTTLGSQQTKKSSGEITPEEIQETRGPAAATQPTEGGDSTDSILEKMSESKDKSKVESDSSTLGSQQTKKSSGEINSGDTQKTPGPAAARQPIEGGDSTDSILEKMSESKDKSKVESDSTTLGSQQTKKSNGEANSGDTQETPGPAAATQPTEGGDSTDSILEKMSESKDKSKVESDSTTLGSQQTKKSSGEITPEEIQETRGPAAATQPTERGDSTDSILEKMSESKGKSKVESDSTTLGSQQTKKSSSETTSADNQETPEPVATTQPTEGIDSTDSILEKISESKDKTKVESDSTMLESQQTKKSSGEINSGDTQETPGPAAARQPTEGGDSTDSILEKMSESKDKSKVESDFTTLGSQQTKKSSDEATSGDIQETPGPAATTQTTEGGDLAASIIEKMSKSKDKSKVESDSTTLVSQQTKKSSGETTLGDTQKTPGPAAATQPTEEADSTDSTLEKMSKSKDKSKVESDSSTLGSQQTKKSSGEINSSDTQETPGPAAARQPTEGGDSTDSILEKISESKDKSKIESDYTTLGSQQTKKSSDEVTSGDTKETPGPDATTQPTRGDSTDSIVEKISKSKDKSKVESDSITLGSQQTKKSKGEANSGDTQETPGPAAATQPTKGGDSTDSILEKMSESKDKSKVESDSTMLGSQQTKKSSGEITPEEIQETRGPAAATQPTEGGDSTDSILEKMSESKDKSKVELDSTTLGSQQTKKSNSEATSADNQETLEPAAATQPTEGIDSTDSILEKISESKDKTKVESDSTTLESQQTKKSSGEINSGDTQKTPGPAAARQPTEGGDSTDSILEKMSESKGKSKDESDSITLGSQQTKKSSGEITLEDTQETPGPDAATQPTEGGDSTDSILEKMSESKDKSKVESDSTTLGSQQTKKSSGEITPEGIQETRGPAAATQPTEGGDSTDSILEKMSESKDKSKVESDSSTLGSQQTKKSSGEINSSDTQETPGPAAARQPTEGGDSTDSILNKISESKDKSKVESDSTTLGSQQTKKSSDEVTSGDIQETPGPDATTQPTEGGDSADSILEKIPKSKDKSKAESDSTTLGSQQTKTSSGEAISGDTQQTPGPAAATMPKGGDSADSIVEKMPKSKDKSKAELDSITLGSQQIKTSSGEAISGDTKQTPGPAAATPPKEGGDSANSIVEKISKSKNKSKAESDSTMLGSQQTKTSSGEASSGDTQQTPGSAAATPPTE